MRKQYWLNFIDQYTVPLNKREWDLLPLGKFEGPGKLKQVREDRSIGIELEDKELEDIGDLQGGRLRIYVRTSLAVRERSSRSVFFDAEILDTSDEESLSFFWRHREKHGVNIEGQLPKEYRFEHAACIPWEEILLIEYVGLASRISL